MKKDNDENTPLFLPAPFYMMRTPLLPIEEFFFLVKQNLSEECLLPYYLGDEKLREAILIASPTLHEALQKMDEKNGREKQQILSSLLKYILRMSTRSTPFGLFASVTLGKWGTETSIHFDLEQIKKHARPDMEWLMAVIDRICSYPESFNTLSIQANPLLFRNGNRLILNDIRCNDDDEKKKKVSINATPLVNAIWMLAKQSMSVEQLIEKVLEQMPSLEGEKIREVILQLLKQQILVFTLCPSLLTSSVFHDLLKKLSEAEAQVKDNAALNIPEISKLKEIASKIAIYNQQAPGQGEVLLKEIESCMRSVATSTHFLQVDSTFRSEKLLLNGKIGDELSETAEVLWRLSFKDNQGLKTYHNKFLEKYGLNRKVPLLELLSNEGLGLPEMYTYSHLEKHSISSKEMEWSQWLKREWCRCLHERSKEITLNKQQLDQILGPVTNHEQAPLFLNYFAKSLQNHQHTSIEGNFC